MLEYPEIHHIAEQMQQTILGKTIRSVDFPGAERKFVFSQQNEAEFNQRLNGGTIQRVEAVGNHLFLFTDHGMAFNVGDTGGKILYHPSPEKAPKKFDLQMNFTDGSVLTISIQMWGFVGAVSEEEARAQQQRIRAEARDPLSPEVSPHDFLRWLAEWADAPRTSAKKWIISRKYVTGLGNGYVQEILWRARIHPRRKMDTLSRSEATTLITCTQNVAREALAQGGRQAERDLFDQPGGFETALNKDTVNGPCPDCGTIIEKFSFEGGACYICPVCQPLNPEQQETMQDQREAEQFHAPQE